MMESGDEDLDEIPVDSDFLDPGDEANLDEEKCDPLMIDFSQDVLDSAPTATNNPLLERKRVITRVTGRCTRDVSSAQERLPATNIFEKPTTWNTSSLTKVPVQKTVTAPKPMLTPPSVYKTMTFAEFTREMEQNIQDIVKESIGLFDRDPQEYHPFYLRIFKYVTIGQRFGFLATDEASVNSIWTRYFKFADAQYEASRKQSVSFNGDTSPYATFILTRKLVVNGKEITEKRNEIEVQKKFKEIEAKAKKIRDEWDTRASPQNDIGHDYKTRLNFFKECMTFTHPADCVKMNKLWTKLLSKEGFSDCKLTTRLREGEPAKNVNVKTESVIPAVTIPPGDEDDRSSNKNWEGASNRNEEESRKSSKKLIIKVIVAPPSSPTTVSTNDVTSSLAVPKCESPSPPCSPAYSAAPSPPSSPEPAPSSPLPFSITTPDKSKYIIEESDRKKNQTEHVKTSKIVNMSVSRKTVKRNTASNFCLIGKRRARKISGKIRKLLEPTSARGLKKKSRKLFSNLSACRMRNNYNEEQQVLRQIQIEKMINQSKSKLLSAVVKKKKVKDIVVGKSSVKAEKESRSKNSRALSKTQPLTENNQKTWKAAKKKKMVSGESKKADTLAKQKLSSTKFNSFVEKRKKRKNLLEKKKVNSDILQKRLEKVTNGDESEDKYEKYITETEKTNARIRQAIYDKYAHVTTNCPIATCGKQFTFRSIYDHLKQRHDIVEDGEMWICPVCSLEFGRRHTWLAHIERLHNDSEIDLDEMVEVARNLLAEINWNDVRFMVRKRSKKVAPQYIVDTSTSKEPFERCDECGVDVVVGYLSIHKEGAHNPDRHGSKCQVCEETFSVHYRVWNHYCEEHMDDGHPLKSLDPAISDRVQRFVKEQLPASGASTFVSCEQCNKIFSNHSMLTRHLYVAHGKVHLQCKYCQKSFQKKETLVLHVKQEHGGEKKDTCEKCGHYCYTPGKLWRHLIDEHGVSAFEAADYCRVTFVPCTYCGLELLEGRQYNNHMAIQHPSFENTSTKWDLDLPCPHCPEKFKNGRLLKRHVKLTHNGTVMYNKYECDRCDGKDFKRPSTLWRHLIDDHNLSAYEAAVHCKVEFVQCAYCGHEMLKGSHCIHHVKTQHPEHFEEFMAAERLVREQNKTERKKSGDAEYARVVAEKRKKAVKEWWRKWYEEGIGPAWMHRQSKKIPGCSDSGWCPECGEHITKMLSRHMSLMHGITNDPNQQYTQPLCPFQDCSVTFARKNVKEHVRIFHTDEIDRRIIEKKIVKLVEETEFCVIHQCTLCETYLYHFEEVKVHMFDSHPEIFADLVESFPFEFPCPRCPLRFSLDEDVRCHIEQVHPQLCWRCPECSKVMISRDDFDKHFKSNHSGEDNNSKEPKNTDEGFLVTIIRTKIISAEREKEIRNILQRERDQRKRQQKTKLRSIMVACEICNMEIPLGKIVQHFSKVHGVVEDGDPIACTKCKNSVQFDVNNQDARYLFLHHMEIYHSNDINMMEETNKIMGKIYTKVDWHTLEVKNPQGLPPGENQERGLKSKLSSSHNDEDKTSDEEDFDKASISSDTSLVNATLRDSEWKLPGSKIKLKFRSVRGNCEICNQEITLGRLSTHIRGIHGIVEDGHPVFCKICANPPKFTLHKWSGRSAYMLHAEKYHADQIDREEILKFVSKVDTIKDWRTLEIKNPHGKLNRKLRAALKRKMRKTTSERREPQGPRKRSRTEVSKARKNEQPDPLPVRVSRRKRPQPGKYAKYFDSDDDDEVGDLSENEKCTSSDSDFNSDSDIEVKEGKRKVGRIPSVTKVKQNKKCGQSSSEHNNIELEKKLVIKLVRLTEDELGRYCRNDGGEQIQS